MENRNKSFNDILKLAAGITKIQKQADDLGLFTSARELLECSNCGLMEDVTFEGRLITYIKSEHIENNIKDDSGLRFNETDKPNIFVCPKCRNCVELSMEENGHE